MDRRARNDPNEKINTDLGRKVLFLLDVYFDFNDLFENMRERFRLRGNRSIKNKEWLIIEVHIISTTVWGFTMATE